MPHRGSVGSVEPRSGGNQYPPSQAEPIVEPGVSAESTGPCAHRAKLWPSNYEWRCVHCRLVGTGMALGGQFAL